MLKNILIFIIFLSHLLPLSAQTTVFPAERYTQKDGLPGNEVNSILQDDYGFLWIGTNKGLCRYDGYQFKEIEFNTKSTSYGYKQPSVHQLFLDKNDNIRFKNSSNLYLYDKVNSPFADQTFQLGLTVDDQKKIRQITNSESGDIWVSYLEDSLGRYNEELKRFDNYALDSRMMPKDLSNKTIKFIDKKNNIWLQDDSTALFVGTLNEQATQIDWKISADTSDFNYKMLEDESGDVFAYKAQILKFDSNTNQFTTYLSAKMLRKEGINLIKTMVAADSKMFMVSYDDRVFIYDTKSHTFQAISDTLNTNINTIFRTNTGTIWLGTSEGLVKLSRVFNWNYLLHNSNSITSSRQEVISIFQDKQDRTWLGTANSSIIRFDNNKISKSYYLQHSVNAITQDLNNHIWAGGSTLGQAAIYQFDEENNTFSQAESWLKRYSELSEFEFQTLINSYDNRLWAGGKGQLLNMSMGLDSSLITYPLLPCDDPDFAQKYATINVILEDANHHLWLAANGSKVYLYYFDPVTGTSDCLHPFLKEEDNFAIYAMQESNSTTLWLGTEGGLFELDKTNRQVLNHYTTKSGLPTDKICSILTDELGNLWISTLKGLSYFNVLSQEFNNFGREDMLGIETFHEQAAYKNEETGELFFGGINGMVNFHPDSLLNFIKSVPLPQVLITRMAVFGETVSTQQPIYQQEEVVLDKGEDYFELEFLVPHPGNLNCRYRYKLEGIEDNWNYTTQYQNVNYKNLSPGSYTFQVQARSFTNNWEDNSRSLKITIKPYFYQTNLFRVALFLLICSIIGGSIYLRFRFLKLEKETQEKELQRKTALLKALSSQMNPHFLYNSLNSINNFIANQDKRKANEYLADFATLMRMILNHSKLEQISLKKELECLELYLKLEHLRAGHKFDYSVNVDKLINTSDIFVPPMIIQPFIENAIWHGLHHKKEKGNLDLTVNRSNGHIVCHVIDDGIGIKKSKELQIGKTRKSTGIENVQERLRILNGIDQQGLKLEIKEPKHGGTHIEITIAAV